MRRLGSDAQTCGGLQRAARWPPAGAQASPRAARAAALPPLAGTPGTRPERGHRDCWAPPAAWVPLPSASFHRGGWGLPTAEVGGGPATRSMAVCVRPCSGQLCFWKEEMAELGRGASHQFPGRGPGGSLGVSSQGWGPLSVCRLQAGGAALNRNDLVSSGLAPRPPPWLRQAGFAAVPDQSKQSRKEEGGSAVSMATSRGGGSGLWGWECDFRGCVGWGRFPQKINREGRPHSPWRAQGHHMQCGWRAARAGALGVPGESPNPGLAGPFWETHLLGN